MMVEDRAGVGSAQLEKAAQQILLAADERARACAVVITTFNCQKPATATRIDRTMAESLGVTMNDVFQTLQTYLGSTYVNLFNKFNQSFQVRVQADADYRRQLDDISNLYVANRDGPDGAAGRSDQCPPGARVGTDHALQSISRGAAHRAVLRPATAPARR